MPVSACSTTIGQQIRHRGRNLPPFAAADEPVIPKPSSRICKSAMSSLFLLPTSTASNVFSLGCTASASQQVSVPAVIRSSADWDAGNLKINKKNKARAKKKKKKNKKGNSYNGGSAIKILSEADRSVGGGSACAAIPDVWCGPGVGFSTDAVVAGSIDIPVDSDPPRRNIPARRKIDGDNNQRERSSLLPRRSLNQESNPYLESEQTLFSDRYHRHLRQPYPDGLSEMMMLQNGFVMGGIFSSYDHFRNMRLNVDNMSYEQLLELGDRIGYVNTGLDENQIKTCLRKVKPCRRDSPLADRKCVICQEEYEAKDAVGKLRCGHRFHIHCVKQWLSRKNSCPVCKTMPFVVS